MTRALVHRPSPRLAECELTWIEAEPIDIERARAQHAAYVRALERLGARVEVCTVNPDWPDSAFVEDTAVVLDDCAVITPMGSAARRAEIPAMAEVIARYRRCEWIRPPARLEGGDVLALGATLFTGVGGRSDPDGVAALSQIAEPLGYQVEPVPVFGCLHLKTGVTALDDRTVVINPDWVDAAAFAGLRRIRVDGGEPWAANTLTLGGTTLVQAGHPRTAAAIEAAGYRVEALDISEFARAEAGLTCLSLLFPER